MLPSHLSYGAFSRLASPSEGATAGVVAGQGWLLLAAGALAAGLVVLLPFPIRVPGHAILKAALPMIAGLALAPRPLAGSIAGFGAATAMTVMLALRVGHPQAAAVTALLALGPAMDLAVRGARRGGWRLYLRLSLAGMAANLVAFAVRWGVAWLDADPFAQHSLKRFGVGVALSFALCGLLAGLTSAAACFRGDDAAARGHA